MNSFNNVWIHNISESLLFLLFVFLPTDSPREVYTLCAVFPKDSSNKPGGLGQVSKADLLSSSVGSLVASPGLSTLHPSLSDKVVFCIDYRAPVHNKL